MDLVKPIVSSENTENVLPTYLLLCKDQSSFLVEDASQEKSFLGIINSKLNETSSKFVGLSLLHTYLQQCPQNVINDNAISWMSLCLRGTVIPVPSTCSLSYEVLGSLIQLCSDQAKHVGSAVLPKLFDHFHSVPKQCLPSALNCLESCMKVYSGPCGPHKNSIVKFLIPLLEFKGPNAAAVVWKTASCLALVPKLGGGGAGGLGYQENWTKQIKSACRTLYGILSSLFGSVHGLEIDSAETFGVPGLESFPFESIKDKNPISSGYVQLLRLEGVACCIEAMLTVELGIVKNVPPNDVLGVVCRGLAVTTVSLGNISTTESMVLSSILPKIHTKLFQLLNALIDCCGANLLPFGRLVVKLVLQTLKWTSVKDWKPQTSKPYGSLRTNAYQSLKHWMDTVKTVPTCDELGEVVEICCSDFRSEVEGVRLSVGKKKNKYSDRNEAKRKRSLNNSQDSWTADPDSIRIDTAANKDVCIAALQAVQALLAHHGWALNTGSYTMLQEAVVKILLSVTSRAHNPVIPYGLPGPRLELYRLLLSLVTYPHPLVAAPIRIAWRLFSIGQNDSNHEVSVFCSHALNVVEKVVNPSFTPLALPLPDTEVENNESDPIFTSHYSTNAAQVTKTRDNQSGKEDNINDLANIPQQSENRVKGTKITEKKRKSNQSTSDVVEKTRNSKKSKKNHEKKVIEDVDELSNASTLSNGFSSTASKNVKKIMESQNEMLFVSDSNSGGADIEEVPVEIDIADSDGDSSSNEPRRGMLASIEREKNLLGLSRRKDDILKDSQAANGVEIIDDSSSNCSAGDVTAADEDFRLCVTPDISGQNKERATALGEVTNETLPSKTDSRTPSGKDQLPADVTIPDKPKEKVVSVLSENEEHMREWDELSSSKNVVTVPEDTSENESDVETMIASFVDKVKSPLGDTKGAE